MNRRKTFNYGWDSLGRESLPKQIAFAVTYLAKRQAFDDKVLWMNRLGSLPPCLQARRLGTQIHLDNHIFSVGLVSKVRKAPQGNSTRQRMRSGIRLRGSAFWPGEALPAVGVKE